MNLREDLDFNQLALILKENRNEANFTPLYIRSKPIIERYINYYIKDQEHADDVLTDTMVLIYEKIHMYDPTYKFITWAYTITRNVCIWEIRRQKKLSSIDAMDEIAIQKFEHTQGMEDPNYEFFEKIADQEQILDRVLDLMQIMPNTYKDIVIDRELKRLSMKDLSNKYNLNENTIKTKLRCGRQWLKDTYNKEFKNNTEIISFINSSVS